MTLSTSAYNTTGNQPLNHARILWNKLRGTVTATGTNGALADNDYTFQRWALTAGENTWDMTSIDDGEIDTLFIGAHSLAGNAVRPQYKGASATNLLLRSEEFDNAAWIKQQATVAANAEVAPDGTATADKLIATAVNNVHQVARTGLPTFTAGQVLTVSVFAKPAEYDRFELQINNAGAGVNATFSISTSSVISTTNSVANIVSVGNGWVRASMQFAMVSTLSPALLIQLNNGVSEGFLGDGTSGIYIWGAQLQTGALSSYIRTTSATVTSDWQDMIPASPWVSVTDNSTIAVMANDGLGQPFQTTGFRVTVSNAVGNETVGIIRAGKALQMQRPVFGGVQPIGLSRIVETRHAMSETGQWLGRTIQRQARRTSMNWMHLNSAWYRSEFEPFSLALPQTPFGLIQNPLRMPESVAWCWTDETPAPENMGIRDLMSVSLGITGYLE